MRKRRGVALIAGLWLVVAIAAVALQLSIDAKDRRTLGLAAGDRGTARAAARGAFAMLDAKLDYALRVAPTGNGVQRLRASDPWLDADSLYSGPMDVDSITVYVTAIDLGTQLNVNAATEDQLRIMFGFLLKDYQTADRLAQCIMDWRDVDTIPRPNGAEADQYIKDGLLALPSNAPFRDLSELLNVEGMTPDIYAKISPYLRTRGTAAINLNTAPEAVLRTLPGMNDQILARILSMRSQGQRIATVQQVMPQQGAVTRRVLPGGQVVTTAPGAGVLAAITAAATVITQEIEFTLVARQSPAARPARVSVILRRTGTTASVPTYGYHEW